MRIYLVLLFTGLFFFVSHAQTDTLFMKKGHFITGKLLHYDSKKVKYKTFEDTHLDIDREIPAKFVISIKRGDGTLLLFEDSTWIETTDGTLQEAQMKNDQFAYNMGLLDGSRRYNRAEPGATAFLLNALCVGLIPSIIMAQVPPNDRYFDIQDKSLYKNVAYMKGFNHGAFTVKKKKVFKNTVIGLSIPLFVFVASRGIR